MSSDRYTTSLRVVYVWILFSFSHLCFFFFMTVKRPPWTPQTWLHALPYLWLFKNTHTQKTTTTTTTGKREKQQQDVIDLRVKTTLFINRFFFRYIFKMTNNKKGILFFCFFVLFFFFTLDNATWWIAERYSVYVKERKIYPSLIDFLYFPFVQLYRCRGPWREIYPFSYTGERTQAISDHSWQ